MSILGKYKWSVGPLCPVILSLNFNTIQYVTVSGRRQLRSSDVNTCVIQRTRSRLVDRSFAVAGPHLWNSLPVGLRHINLSIGQFRSALKTHLFN